MSFSKEWDEAYKVGKKRCVWPWSSVVSLCHRYGNLTPGIRVMEIGCGTGANIPFFVSVGAKYFSIEGSQTAVKEMKEKYQDDDVRILQGDFTEQAAWDSILPGGVYDLVVDRASLISGNNTKDIEGCIKLIHDHLAVGGKYIGVGWLSDKYTDITINAHTKADDWTYEFTEGYFSGMGLYHFCNEEHMRNLFHDFTIEYLDETITYVKDPEERVLATWNIVAKK